MILVVHDESRRGNFRRLIAMTALTVRGILPSVVPAVLQGCHECLNPAKVLVVPAVFFCQQGVDRMMKVIRPLRVDPVASLNAIRSKRESFKSLSAMSCISRPRRWAS